MNVGQLLQKVYDLITAARVGNYLVALSLAFEIVKAITDNLPPLSLSTPPAVHGNGHESLDDLLDSLQACCDNPPVAATAAVDGAVINVLLPLLQPIISALLKKWLGL